MRSKRPMHAKRGVFVHALRVQVGGGAPTPREMPRSGSSETAFAVSCFEVCKTSKLHSTRSVLPRQGHAFYAMESFRKGNGFILFASAKRTKKQLLGRAKSCQWQVFVRRRPPKQGELRTDVSKATMFQGVDFVLRPRFKSPVDTLF